MSRARGHRASGRDSGHSRGVQEPGACALEAGTWQSRGRDGRGARGSESELGRGNGLIQGGGAPGAPGLSPAKPSHRFFCGLRLVWGLFNSHRSRARAISICLCYSRVDPDKYQLDVPPAQKAHFPPRPHLSQRDSRVTPRASRRHSLPACGEDSASACLCPRALRQYALTPPPLACAGVPHHHLQNRGRGISRTRAPQKRNGILRAHSVLCPGSRGGRRPQGRRLGSEQSQGQHQELTVPWSRSRLPRSLAWA